LLHCLLPSGWDCLGSIRCQHVDLCLVRVGCCRFDEHMFHACIRLNLASGLGLRAFLHLIVSTNH
jgi:hypothetical protein